MPIFVKFKTKNIKYHFFIKIVRKHCNVSIMVARKQLMHNDQD